MSAYDMTRYLAAATLVRAADAGAAVGLVLLAVSPATHLENGAAAGGLLAAGLSAPHLLAPWMGRRLDAARDGRVLLAGAFAGYGVALGAGSLALGRVPTPVALALVVAAGAAGPLLTGGLSSRLASLAGRAGRRATGWDAVTYGIAGSAGPALVAALGAVTSPLTAMVALSTAALVAAAITLTLPRARTGTGMTREVLSVRAALRALVTHGPLRRVTATNLVTAAGGGVLPVVAAVLGAALSSRPSAGAGLIAAFGLGNLAGSLLVTAFPLRGEPERLAVRHSARMGAGFALCAVAPTYPLALAAFALTGASNAPFFTASLAARSRYSPPGARAQVFVTMAGAKVALAAAGTALAGATVGFGARTLLAAAAALTVAGAGATAVDRRLA